MQPNDKIKRFFETTVERAELSEGQTDDRIRTFSLSSDTPIKYGDISEILSHDPEHVDLSRLNTEAPLLWMHDTTQHIGRIVKAWLENGRLYISAKFSRSKLGSEKLQDLDDGIIRGLSVGAQVHKWEQSEDGKSYIATAWQPFEGSLVTTPADITVGVGRSLQIESTQPQEIEIMSEEIENKPAPDINELRKLERDRQSRIRDMGKVLGVSESEVNKALDSDIQPSDFFAQVSRNHQPTKPQQPEVSQRKADRYDLNKVLQSVASGKELTGLERDLSEEWKATYRSEHGGSAGIVIPPAMLVRNYLMRTGQNAGTAADGGYMVPTETRNSAFIDILAQNTIIGRRGATILEGLSGDVEIPKLTTGATMLHKGEVTASGVSTAQLGQLALSPKRAVTQMYLSNQLIRQTSGAAETIFMSHLQKVAAQTWDKYAIAGSGTSDEPVGIVALTDRNTVTFGGAMIPGDLTDMISKLKEDFTYNSNCVFLFSAAVWAKLAILPTTSGADRFVISDTTNRIWGHEYEDCEYLAATLGGAADRVIFGDLSQLVVGMFGGVEIVRENVTRAGTGETVLTASMYYDIGSRYDQAFCVSTDTGAA
ncbi:MAG TPA: phage major capsid protein [Opitutales bacterium]|nr:phage major capsid protein [Opitutales bacterium]